jgi:hypothetical protein
MKMRRMFLVWIIPAVLITACSGAAPGPQPQNSPVSLVSPLASPIATPVSVAVFQLNRPLLPGATEVRGTGPAGVPIFIADITFMGAPLGTGTIGSDGKFVVTVSPLPDGHRVGVALGVLDGTRWKPEDFYVQDYYGPGAMQFPQVGFFHDTVMVGQP